MDHQDRIEALRRQGVAIPLPQTVEIGDEVPLDQVRGPGTVLGPGTRLLGARTLVQAGARIGTEGPVTLQQCAVGPGVILAAGSFSGAVLLDRVVMGPGAHVREGTLMEEESNGAHTVGLKQTVLLPFVTLGSLINFCDVLMAGGSSRKDHSEVGSSFIHFNFTPFGRHGDKATPSLIGDVPRGVMLRSARIFLGGQAGLVGPLGIEYGTVLAAGFVYRGDHGPDVLVVGENVKPRTLAFNPLRYVRIRIKVEKNLRFIGNLAALWHWYDRVRIPLAGLWGDRNTLYERAREVVAVCIEERIRRLAQVAGYMEDSIRELEREGGLEAEVADQRWLSGHWPSMERSLKGYAGLGDAGEAYFVSLRQGLDRCDRQQAGCYLETIRVLDPLAVEAGIKWLGAIVQQVQGLASLPG